MQLKGKVILLTGAAGGIGRAAALAFAREGASVVLADVDETAGERVAAEVRDAGGEAWFFRVDVTDRQGVSQMVSEARYRYGRIDVLVNNAGITRDAILPNLTEDDWRRVLDVNLSGVLYCTQAAVPVMLEQGRGKIINTASVSGVYGNVGQTNYAAAKAGVIGMTKTWAKELGPKGITVNAVAPGFIETEMTAKVPEKVLAKIRERIPLRRLGKPEDVANVYVFLASDASDYLNGAVLHVDGGIAL